MKSGADRLFAATIKVIEYPPIVNLIHLLRFSVHLHFLELCDRNGYGGKTGQMTGVALDLELRHEFMLISILII